MIKEHYHGLEKLRILNFQNLLERAQKENRSMKTSFFKIQSQPKAKSSKRIKLKRFLVEGKVVVAKRITEGYLVISNKKS